MGIEAVIQQLNSVLGEYTTAALSFVISLVILYIVKNIILVRFDKLAKKTKTKFDDILIDSLEKIGWPFYFVLSLFVAMQFLTLPVVVEKGLNYFVLIVATFYLVKSLASAVNYFVEDSVKEKEKKGKDHEVAVLKLTSKVMIIILWIVAAIFLLSNLGFNISSLIAGLGIGGIAIALALQNILGDIFSSVSIYLDKPFEIGDFIIIGEDMGTVKRIGVKSTRIQTLHGHELVVSNKELTSARVHNYKQMKKRRVILNIGVVYATSSAKMEKIPGIIKNIFKKIKNTELDRVNFREFGPYSLNYEIVYYMLSSDYNEYVKTQEKINLAIKKAFEKEKIEIAFPTQTVYLNK